MSRHVCIHGHFYQPPRENPWTGVLDDEASAAPHPNWNVRITEECYRPNAASRVLDASGSVAERINNYAHVSFDFGPTLAGWLEGHAPDVHAALVAADRESVTRLGHGNAIAQSYHHTILPLAAPQDRETEVRWGLDDFAHRFGRRAEGIWLPETAVCTATLETLAHADLDFTILAPRQARAVRAPDQTDWCPVDADSIDTRRPYKVQLPSGRSIAVFFYDGPRSRAVAFDDVLRDGAAFAAGLAGAAEGVDGDTLTHIATDGESYGHHHRFGDMALAFCIRQLTQRSDVVLTNHAAYLSSHPVEWEARVNEGSSWSCAHGVERWRSDCGCASDARSSGAQGWRVPLRQALDWLRDQLAGFYQESARCLVRDPWALRDGYAAAELSGPDGVRELCDRAAHRQLDEEARRRLEALLQMQRFALRMFSSCGWFFDDPTDIATVQDLRSAHRAIVATSDLAGPELEPEFVERLRGLSSSERGLDAAEIWADLVLAAYPDASSRSR